MVFASIGGEPEAACVDGLQNFAVFQLAKSLPHDLDEEVSPPFGVSWRRAAIELFVQILGIPLLESVVKAVTHLVKRSAAFVDLEARNARLEEGANGDWMIVARITVVHKKLRPKPPKEVPDDRAVGVMVHSTGRDESNVELITGVGGQLHRELSLSMKKHNDTLLLS